MKHSAPVHILFGGSSDERDDYATLQNAASSGKSTSWSCLKNGRKGDRVLIYCTEPQGSVVASAELMKDATPGSDWAYVTRLGNVRVLDAPISRQEIQRMFPTWRWAKSTRGQTYVEQSMGDSLWERAQRELGEVEATEPSTNGAGLGSAETNRLVEVAAVERVTELLKERGYRVVSRESERIGYDLDAIKGRRTLHVEVKGITGQGLQFPITKGEVAQAEQDSNFRLFAVTGARSSGFEVHEFTGPEFIKAFSLTPLSYIATRKRAKGRQ
jgi:hypothetical protein